MLKPAAESLLCALLARLGQLEKGVEIQRIILSEDPTFSPHLAFDHLDTLRIGWLIPKTIKDFLPRLDLTEQETYMVIRQYASRTNSRLSKPDFKRLVLPGSNPTLSKLAASRCSSSFTYAQEYALSRLLEREVGLHIELEKIKNDLNQCEGFSVWKAYKSIDKNSHGSIAEEDIVMFGKKNGHYFFRGLQYKNKGFRDDES